MGTLLTLWFNLFVSLIETRNQMATLQYLETRGHWDPLQGWEVCHVGLEAAGHCWELPGWLLQQEVCPVGLEAPGHCWELQGWLIQQHVGHEPP